MSQDAFKGFPAVARATAIPNLFFASVLPRLDHPGSLLTFLWASRLIQEQRGDARYISADQVWAEPGVQASFERLAGGRPGLDHGLAACVEVAALLALGLSSPGSQETVYFVNNPQSRRAVARARAGELQLQPGAVLHESPQERPGIFRMYEEHIGTITPFVAERLLLATDRFPADWVEDAFREAAELNARNWRYVERILENWEREGRAYETPGRDSLEQRKRRFLGGSLGSAAPRR